MTTREQNEINQNINRLDRIKHKMANPRERDTHVRRDRAWLVTEIERQREILDRLPKWADCLVDAVNQLHGIRHTGTAKQSIDYVERCIRTDIARERINQCDGH